MAARKTRYDSQIQSETSLKFGPQADALALLLEQARRDRSSSIAVQRGLQRGLTVSATAAMPEIRQTVQDFQSGLTQPGASAEQSAIAAQLRREGASAAQELVGRQLDAQAGLIGGIRKADADYADTRDKVADALRSLAGQEGNYASSRLAELLQDDRKMAHDTAQSRADRQSREGIAAADRTSRESIAAQRNQDKKKPKWATPQQTGSFKDKVEQLRGWIRQNKGDYSGRSELAQDLLNGQPGSSVLDPKTGQLIKDPGVPKASSQLALSVALDLEFDQHVSKKNVAELHRRRYRVRSLGYPTQGPKPKPVPAPAPGGFPGMGALGPVTVR